LSSFNFIYNNMDRVNGEENCYWIDHIVATMCKHFCLTEDQAPLLRLPWALISYLNQRQLPDAIGMVISILPTRLWDVVAQTILNGPSHIQKYPPPIGPVEGPSPLMVALWHMYYHDGSSRNVKPSTWQATPFQSLNPNLTCLLWQWPSGPH
jgi:hypothetical protein